jgi:hypothetical protein
METDSQRNIYNGSSGQPGVLLEISYFKGKLQYIIFYNIILGLEKTTNSQDQFPAIQGEPRAITEEPSLRIKEPCPCTGERFSQVRENHAPEEENNAPYRRTIPQPKRTMSQYREIPPQFRRTSCPNTEGRAVVQENIMPKYNGNCTPVQENHVQVQQNHAPDRDTTGNHPQVQ